MKVVQSIQLAVAMIALTMSVAVASPKQPCDTQKSQCCDTMQRCGQGGHYVAHIKGALKKLPLDEKHWADVKMAVDVYRKSMQEIKRGLPLKALENGTFNKEAFIQMHPMTKRLEAKAELMETIYMLLTDEQKKRMPMLLGAEAYFGGGMCQERLQCDGKGPKCDGSGPQCNGKGPKCDNKGPKCDGTGPQCDGKGPKCDGTGPNAKK